MVFADVCVLQMASSSSTILDSPFTTNRLEPSQPIRINNNQYHYLLSKHRVNTHPYQHSSTLVQTKPLYHYKCHTLQSKPTTSSFYWAQQISPIENDRNFLLRLLFLNKIQNKATVVQSSSHPDKQVLLVYHRYVEYSECFSTHNHHFNHVLVALTLDLKNSKIESIKDLTFIIGSTDNTMLQMINHANECRICMKHKQTGDIYYFICDIDNDMNFSRYQQHNPTPLADHILLSDHNNIYNNNTNNKANLYSIITTLFMNRHHPRSPPPHPSHPFSAVLCCHNYNKKTCKTSIQPHATSIQIMRQQDNNNNNNNFHCTDYYIEFDCIVMLKGKLCVVIDNNGKLFIFDIFRNIIRYMYQVFITSSEGPFIPILITQNTDLIMNAFVNRAKGLLFIPQYIVKLMTQFYCEEKLYFMIKMNTLVLQHKIIQINVDELIQEFYFHLKRQN